jgi:hypothetical protein
MYERKKEEKRDEQLSGELFEDWDNPEDLDEDAPEGYYDEEQDEGYIPDEDDPDYDLSEAHGYSEWEPAGDSIIPQWAIVLASMLLIFAVLIGILIGIS